MSRWSHVQGRGGPRTAFRGPHCHGILLGLLMIGVPAAAIAQEGKDPPQRAPEQRPSEDLTLEQPAAQERATHEVRRGDTLWDLAGRYMQDSFRWPELFQANRSVVEDPHWIYPGEVLALPDGARVALATPSTPGMAMPGQTWQPSSPGAGAGVSGFGGTSLFDTSPDAGNVMGGLDIDVYSEPALVSESDFYRAPFLIGIDDTRRVGAAARKIEGNPLHLEMPPSVRLNDLVVVSLNGISIAPGETMQAFHVQSGPAGRPMFRSVALLEVSEIEGDSARATVERLFGDFQVGDPVVLADPFLVPVEITQTPVDGGMATELLGFEVTQAILGEGDMVFLATGESGGVRIGDEFAVFDVAETASARWEDRLATVRVVRVRSTTATARVVDLRDTSPEPGAPARLVRRAVGG